MRGLLLFFLMCCLASAQAEVSEGWYHEVRPLYAGIPVQVRFAPADEVLGNEVWRYLADVDEFNDYRDDSALGRINAGGPGRYPLSPRMAEAFATAAHLNRLSEGAFDITVGPLRRLWREAERSGVPPTAEAIAVVHRAVGPDTWRLEGATLEVLVPGVRFDFGGLIKGMSVDHAMRLLVDAGVQAALVQSSGESGCFGMSVRGKPHVLGIPDPDAPDGRLWCAIGDQGHGFSGSTSGNYRNAIQVGGRPYYHIFDPRTGQPVDTHVLSVSVAFPVGFRNGLADGLTKVGAVLGWEKMHAIAERLGGGALVLIRRADGTVEEHASPTWERLQVKSHARVLSEQTASNDQQKSAPMTIRVRIRPGCTGMGACVRLAPDVFRIDPDTGKAVVLVEDASAFRSAVQAAKDSCPFVAVDLDGAVDDSGTCDEVTVVGVQIIATEVLELRLRRPGFHYTPGQYAFVRHRDGQGEFHRAYSVVSNHDDEVTFCIRILANGRGGRALAALKPGDVVGLGPAVGRFSLASLSRPKLFVAGGTGLAPVVPMCRAAHAAPKTVIVGARNESDLFWLDDLRAIPNTTVIPVLEAPGAEWTGHTGRVTDVMRDLDAAAFAEFYTCGSPGMVAAVAKHLRERGVSDDRIHSDSFLPAPPAAMVSPSAASVREPFDWQGLLRRWHFYASLSLAGLILFYAVTGFIANRADLFHGEETASVKHVAATIPNGVALTADALTAYLSGVLPEGSHCTVCSTEPGRDCTLTFALPDVAGEKREAIAMVKRADRSFTLTEWVKLPADQALDREALTAFVLARISGDPDLKNREDDDETFRLDCESVWGAHAVTVDKAARRWQVTTTDQTPVVAIVDLHRGKHAGGMQKVLVDLTAILLAFVTASGIAMGLGAAAHRRRMLAGALVLGSLVLLTAFLVFR